MQGKTDKDLESARVSTYPVDAEGVAAPDITGETSAVTRPSLWGGVAGERVS